MTDGRKKRGSLCVTSKPLQPKIARLWSETEHNKSIDWVKLVHTAAVKLIFRLHIPHTLVVTDQEQSVLLFTDSEGVVRCRNEETTRVAREFADCCGIERRKERNLNPSGRKFPRFIWRNEGLLVDKKRDIRGNLHPGVIQRYVIPHGFVPFLRIIKWRRTKPTKVYTVSLRPDQGDKQLISRLEIEGCDARLEPRMSESEERTMTAVRSLVEREAGDGERLEELAVTVMQGLQGDCYFLAVQRVRTSELQPGDVKKTRRSSLADLSSRIQATDVVSPLPPLEILPIPHAAPKDCPVSFQRRYSEISDHIDFIATKFDKITEEAKERKAAYEVYKALTGPEYGPGFFDNVVKVISVNICRNPVLAPFFGGNESRVEEIVRKILVVGVDPQKLQSTHTALGINPSEFRSFVSVFEDSLRRQGVTDLDISRTLLYLNSFQSLLVVRSPARDPG